MAAVWGVDGRAVLTALDALPEQVSCALPFVWLEESKSKQHLAGMHVTRARFQFPLVFGCRMC